MPNSPRMVRPKRRRRGEPQAALGLPAPQATPVPGWFVWQMRVMHWALIGVPIFFFALAWGMLARGIGDWRLSVESKEWPTTSGVVLTSEVVERLRAKSDEWEPRVTYSYTVAGMSYVGVTVRSGGYGFERRAGAEAKQAEYPVGAIVEVRYDPDDPGRSVLEFGGGGGWVTLVLSGVVLLIAGVAVVGYMIRDVWAGVKHGRARRR